MADRIEIIVLAAECLALTVLRIQAGVDLDPGDATLFSQPKHPDLFHTCPLPGVVRINIAHMANVNTIDPHDLSRTEGRLRSKVERIVSGSMTNPPAGYGSRSPHGQRRFASSLSSPQIARGLAWPACAPTRNARHASCVLQVMPQFFPVSKLLGR